jgi:hypothetical protein
LYSIFNITKLRGINYSKRLARCAAPRDPMARAGDEALQKRINYANGQPCLRLSDLGEGFLL